MIVDDLPRLARIVADEAAYADRPGPREHLFGARLPLRSGLRVEVAVAVDEPAPRRGKGRGSRDFDAMGVRTLRTAAVDARDMYEVVHRKWHPLRVESQVIPDDLAACRSVLVRGTKNAHRYAEVPIVTDEQRLLLAYARRHATGTKETLFGNLHRMRKELKDACEAEKLRKKGRRPVCGDFSRPTFPQGNVAWTRRDGA